MIKIIEKSPVTTWISEPKAIRNFLRYETEWWVQGPYRKEKKTAYVSLVKKGGHFLSGFQDRVFGYLDDRGIEFTFEKPDYVIPCKQPKLEGIDFGSWLQDIPLGEMIKGRRGVWEAPTGAGKTMLLAGLSSAFYDTRTLIIVPTQGIFLQTIKKLQRWYEEKLGWIGDGKRKDGDIVVAIINSLAALGDLSSFGKYWGMVIVDEAHRVSKFKGMYFKVLTAVQTPLRFALTGTMPTKEESKWALEGLIGPWMGKTEEGVLEEIGVLAKPKLRIIKIPLNNRIRGYKSYKQVYEWGVIKYRKRNTLIMEAVRDELKDDLTGLVFVLRIRHGLLLEELFSLVYGADQVRFVVSGPPAELARELEAVTEAKNKASTKKLQVEQKLEEWKAAKVSRQVIDSLEKEVEYLNFVENAFADDVKRLKVSIGKFHEVSKRREEYRLGLDAKIYRVAVATTSWREGIDIPSLNLVWNATGAKSEIMNTQFFGRGRRATETKSVVILGDCFDSTHPFLVDAFGDRISLYCDKGWL